MRKPFILLIALLVPCWVAPVLAPGFAPAFAQASAQAPAAAPSAADANAPLTATQAQQALDVLQNDKRRADVVTALEAIAKVSAPPPALPLAPDSLGAQVIVQVSGALSEAGSQLAASIHSVNDLPLLWRWLVGQASSPDARDRVVDAGWKLLVVIAAALAAEWVGRAVLRRLRAALSLGAHRQPAAPVPQDRADEVAEESGLEAAEAGETEHSARQRRLTGALSALRRLPYLFGRLLLDLVPIGLFAVVGNALLGTILGEPPVTRLVIVAAVEAYVATRLVLAVTSMLVTPASARLRLLHVSDWAAEFLTRWVRRVTIAGIGGYTVAEIGLLFGMYRSAYEALLKLFFLVVHVFLVVMVLEARVPIARRIRSRHGATGPFAILLNRLSEIWHLIAIFYIAALWLVWAVELRNGYVRLVRFFLVTVAVMIVARLLAIVLLGGLDRVRLGPAAARQSHLQARVQTYYPVVRAGLMGLIGVATGVALLESWGLGVLRWLERSGLGGQAASALLLIGLTVVLAVVAWEGANAGLEAHIARLSASAQLARAGRLRTLMPMLRTVLLVAIVAVVALTALSELGVNIAPLLAGAGVVGIAVGFGSQKLVQDLITGLFLLLENAMQVGDVVTLGGLTGTVEALSIRTIRLRATDGSVHLIPFSAVTTVTNQTRDYSYAVLDITVGLNEEPEPVIEVVRAVAEEMRAEERWTPILLEPLEVMGVEKFIDTAWVLRVRVKTQPASRWAVTREMNRRLKMRFDENAIESPFTSHRVLSATPAPAPQPEEAPA